MPLARTVRATVGQRAAPRGGKRRNVAGQSTVALQHARETTHLREAVHQKNRFRIVIVSLGWTLSSSVTLTSVLLPFTRRVAVMPRSEPRSLSPPAIAIACWTVVPGSSTYGPPLRTWPV